jgi:hypothetical protein
MAHVLAKLVDVNFDEFKKKLMADAEENEKQGLFLEHLWRNVENYDEIFFLFRVHDLDQAMKLIKQLHKEAILENPDITLPALTFLEEG